MKLSTGQTDAFLRRPPAEIGMALLYGPDTGLVSERAQRLAAAVLGEDAHDPFRLVILDAETIAKDPARLADEAAQLSLIGGRRVIRLRDPAEATAKLLQPILKRSAADALIIVEAGDLGRASALRKLAEADSAAAAIACYVDGPRELAQILRDAARAQRITLAEDAISYIVAHLGADRMLSRQEIDKVLLFAGDGGRISLADAMALIGDSSALELEEIVYDAFDGNREAAEAGLDRLFLAGEQPISILRAAQRHAQRLHLAAGRVAAGDSTDAVIQSLHLFFKYAPRFRTQLDRWRLPRLAIVLDRLTMAELDCKTTGYPDQTRCRHELAGLYGPARR